MVKWDNATSISNELYMGLYTKVIIIIVVTKSTTNRPSQLSHQPKPIEVLIPQSLEINHVNVTHLLGFEHTSLRVDCNALLIQPQYHQSMFPEEGF